MPIACVVLAAGLGKRMYSSKPKVLHELCGRPMLQYVLDAVEGVNPERTVIVVGKHSEQIRRAVTGSRISYAVQKEPKGTGDALLKALPLLGSFEGTILVLNGDTPLITVNTLKHFLERSRKHADSLSVLSFFAGDPSSYGRIVRDDSGRVRQIIEERDTSPEQKEIREVNSGIYAVSAPVTRLLSRIRINKSKGEYYLTDLVEIAAKEDLRVGVYGIGSEDELVGVNKRQELLRAERVMQERIVNDLIRGGVDFIDPVSVHIHAGVEVGRNTLVYPNVYLERGSRIGRGCTVYPNVRITGSVIGDNTTVKDSSVIEQSEIKKNAQIGPFAHIRPGSSIGSRAKIGNFVEIKKSVVGDGTKASHLSYIGDALVGKDVNIGAGTITCNYDGKEKHRTEIQNGVFIGSDTQLIAPVSIGRGAYVGAGSTITEPVPPMSLALSRVPQKNIRNWVLKKGLTGKGEKKKGGRQKRVR